MQKLDLKALVQADVQRQAEARQRAKAKAATAMIPVTPVAVSRSGDTSVDLDTHFRVPSPTGFKMPRLTRRNKNTDTMWADMTKLNDKLQQEMDAKELVAMRAKQRAQKKHLAAQVAEKLRRREEERLEERRRFQAVLEDVELHKQEEAAKAQLTRDKTLQINKELVPSASSRVQFASHCVA